MSSGRITTQLKCARTGAVWEISTDVDSEESAKDARETHQRWVLATRELLDQKSAVDRALPGTPTKRISWSLETGWTGILKSDKDGWKKAYPACDVERQLAAAEMWLRANPTKGKANYYRFLVNWFSRAQERGGDVKSNRAAGNRTSTANEPGKWSDFE